MSLNILKLDSYIDKSLTKAGNGYSDFNKNYILSIQISLDGFSFCIIDEERNKHVALESYAIQEINDYEELSKELGNLLGSLDIIKRRFNRVNVLFEGNKAALIPFPLFDEDATEHYLKFNHKVEQGEEILFDKLGTLQAYNIFAVPVFLKDLIKSKFINYQIIHFSSSLIECLLIKYKNQDITNKVFVNVRHKYLDIVIIEGSKLVFFNSFKYKTQEDFVYFLIYALEQLKLNPENIDLVLLGEIDKSSRYYEIVFKYIRNIEFIDRNDFFNYSYVLDEVASNYLYNLLNVSTCEL
ncbi:MAG: DUF3822 family protein [Bacteroidetes bacterium]|nr:DUF3822 family protein [Bacteroidota bacterium]